MRALTSLLMAGCSLIPLSALADAAQPLQRPPVTSIKPLLLAAIDNGVAYGELIGKPRDIARQVFKTDAPIEIDVKRIAFHRQPGCAQLDVTTRQAAVVLPTKKGARPSAPKDMTVRYQIDYCRTGKFPAGEQ